MRTIDFKRIGLILFFSMAIGLVVGSIDFLFGEILLQIGQVRNHNFYKIIPFLAPIGLFIIFLYQKWGKNALKGLSLIFEVGHGSQEAIPKRLIPLVMVTTWLTHLFGGSAGREGVAVQIGATTAHHFEKYFPEERTSNLFLLIGMSAGFAGLFQTPLAASFFAIEVLIVGHYSWTAFIPAILAAYAASWTSHFLGLEKFQHLLTNQLDFSLFLLLKLLLLSVALAFIGNAFALLLKKVKDFLAKTCPNPYYRIFLVGLLLSLVMFVLPEGRYAGLGTNLIEASLNGEFISSYDWLFKLLLTVLTLAAGFQGGEVTPLFSIGASAGVVLAGIVGLPFEVAAALGYIAIFASATNTLLAPIFIGIEVFGWTHSPIYVFVIAIAYFLNRKQSIYSAQKVPY